MSLSYKLILPGHANNKYVAVGREGITLNVGDCVCLYGDDKGQTVIEKVTGNTYKRYYGFVVHDFGNGKFCVVEEGRVAIPDSGFVQGAPVYFNLDGTLTSDITKTAFCVGVWDPASNPDKPLLANKGINLTNRKTMEEETARIRNRTQDLISPRKTQIDDINNLMITKVDRSQFVAEIETNPECIEIKVANVEFTSNENSTAKDSTDNRLTELENKLIGKLSGNVNVSNGILTISGSATDISNNVSWVATDAGEVNTLSGTVGIVDNAFNVENINIASFNYGKVKVTLTVTDRFGKPLTVVNHTVYDEPIEQLKPSEGNFIGTAVISDATRTVTINAKALGINVGETVTAIAYNGDYLNGTKVTNSGSVIDANGTVSITDFSISSLAYGYIKVILKALDSDGDLITVPIRVLYKNVSNELYTADGSFGTSGDAFNLV